MVSKRFTVACVAVAVVTLVGQDDNNDSNEKLPLVVVCKFIIAAMATNALVGRLLTLLSSSSSTTNSEAQQSPIESRASRVIKETDDDDCARSLPHNDESTPSSHNNIRWKKPEFGWVKLNVDGSHDHITHPRSSGCGGVLRDSSGTWLLGFSQKLDPSLKVYQTELEAILKGLELVWDMNVEKLVVESDYKPAVSMVEKGLGEKYNRPHFNIVSRIRQLRLDPKWEVKVVHVPNKANRVANRLANDARDLHFEHLHKYPDPPPNCAALIKEDAQAG